MKIWKQGCQFDANLVKQYQIGDIEIFDNYSEKIWLVIALNEDAFIYDRKFNGAVGSSVYRHDITFERIDDYVKLIKNTKIARILYENKIWKENEEWLLIKK